MTDTKKIYVGNLAFACTEDELREKFGQFGEVVSARVITDRETGRSKGFGFVEMDSDNADKAINALNGEEYKGRAMVVNEARPQADNRGGSGGHRKSSRFGSNDRRQSTLA